VRPRRRCPSAGVPSGRGDPDGGGAANVTATDSERAVTRAELTRPRPGWAVDGEDGPRRWVRVPARVSDPLSFSVIIAAGGDAKARRTA
jgi:hypothetical protein